MQRAAGRRRTGPGPGAPPLLLGCTRQQRRRLRDSPRRTGSLEGRQKSAARVWASLLAVFTSSSATGLWTLRPAAALVHASNARCAREQGLRAASIGGAYSARPCHSEELNGGRQRVIHVSWHRLGCRKPYPLRPQRPSAPAAAGRSRPAQPVRLLSCAPVPNVECFIHKQSQTTLEC